MAKKGHLEKQIAEAVVAFWREVLGRGPEDTRTYILQDSGEIEAVIADMTGCQVISSHSDISTKTGERVEIYILDRNVEKLLAGPDANE